MNRRDLLKLFGAGASIIPVIGGVPEIAAPVRLIEVPKIEPVELVRTQDPTRMLSQTFLEAKRVSITVDVVSEDKHYRFSAESFFTKLEHQVYGIYGSPYAPRLSTLGWKLEGICTGMPSAEVSR